MASDWIKFSYQNLLIDSSLKNWQRSALAIQVSWLKESCQPLPLSCSKRLECVIAGP